MNRVIKQAKSQQAKSQTVDSDKTRVLPRVSTLGSKGDKANDAREEASRQLEQRQAFLRTITREELATLLQEDIKALKQTVKLEALAELENEKAEYIQSKIDAGLEHEKSLLGDEKASLQKLNQALEDFLENAKHQIKETQTQREARVLNLLIACLHRICQNADIFAAMAEKVLHQVQQEFLHEDKVTIRFSHKDQNLLAPLFKELGDSSLNIIFDSDLDSKDCIVQSRYSTIDFSQAAHLGQIEQTLESSYSILKEKN